MFDYRAKVLTMASIGALIGSVAACDDPVQATDLRIDGPPLVTAVMIQTDVKVTTYETATFCRLNDIKRPGFVGSIPTIRTAQVCDEDLSKPAETDGSAQAAPSSWYVRVVVDKLLDTNIEELIPQLDAMGAPTGIIQGSFKNTQPVVLTCGGKPVPYDGYYVPNGSNLSWPLGPAVFVRPLKIDSVPVKSKCEITVKDSVTNKKGEPVPTADRTFKFEIAPLQIFATTPKAAATPAEIDAAEPVGIEWNANLAATGGVVDPAKVKLFVKDNLNVGMATEAADPSVCTTGGVEVVAGTDLLAPTRLKNMIIFDSTVVGADAFQRSKTYRLEFTPDATATAKAGGTGEAKLAKPICFFTLPA
jgi:hypothetical protein